jgi:hypothetical protein
MPPTKYDRPPMRRMDRRRRVLRHVLRRFRAPQPLPPGVVVGQFDSPERIVPQARVQPIGR